MILDKDAECGAESRSPKIDILEMFSELAMRGAVEAGSGVRVMV